MVINLHLGKINQYLLENIINNTQTNISLIFNIVISIESSLSYSINFHQITIKLVAIVVIL